MSIIRLLAVTAVAALAATPALAAAPPTDHPGNGKKPDATGQPAPEGKGYRKACQGESK